MTFRVNAETQKVSVRVSVLVVLGPIATAANEVLM